MGRKTGKDLRDPLDMEAERRGRLQQVVRHRARDETGGNGFREEAEVKICS